MPIPYVDHFMKQIDRKEKMTRTVAVIQGIYASTTASRKKEKKVYLHYFSWGGVNCNVCQSDQACQPVKGASATCIKTAVGLKSMHAWCATTSNIAPVLYTCN